MPHNAQIIHIVGLLLFAVPAEAQDTAAARGAASIDRAADPAGAAAAWRKALPALSGVERGRGLWEMGAAMAAGSDSAAALDALDQAAPFLVGAPATERDRARLLATRGSVLGDLNRLDEADMTIDAAIAAWHRIAPDGSGEQAEAVMTKATISFSRGDLTAAKRLGEESIALSQRLRLADDAGRVAALANMSTILLQARDLEGSERYARAATAMAGRVLAEDHPVAIVALSDWVAVLAAQGRRQDAVPILARIAALRERRFGPGYPPLAITYNNLSRNLFFLDQAVQAEPYARRAVAIGARTRAADDQGLAAMRDNLADILDAQDKRAEAVVLRREALAGLGSQGNAARIVRIRRSLGIALIETGDLPGALAEFQAVVAWAQHDRPPGNPDRLEAEATLALVEARLGRRGANGRMRAVLDGVERNLFVGGDATRRQTSVGALLEHLLETAWLTRDRAAGFRVAQLQSLDETGRAVAAALARTAAGKGSVLVRKRQDLLAERDRQSAAALRAFGKNDSEYTTIAAAIVGVDAQLATTERALTRVLPTYAALARFTPLTQTAVQRRLRPDQALVMPATLGKGAVTFVLRQDRAAWAISPKGHDLRADVAAMRLTLGGSDTRGAVSRTPVTRFDLARAHSLYRDLIPVSLDTALKGASTWLLSPSGPFTALPFAVLVTDTPQRGRPPAWLIRKVALVTLPGISDVNSGGAAPGGDRRFLGVGAPALAGTIQPARLRGLYHEGAIDRAALASLAPLPQAEDELKRMSAALPALRPTLLTGAAATETAFKAIPMRDIAVLAFATHGLLGGQESGAEPGLVLTPPAVPSALDDGILSSSEIAALDLDVDWVVLSACDTAAGDRPGAPALSGLARAFLYAGARSLLVSHWAVRDDVAARLTVDAVKREMRGESRAQALRHAMLALIDDPRVPGARDPAVWAPFILVER